MLRPKDVAEICDLFYADIVRYYDIAIRWPAIRFRIIIIYCVYINYGKTAVYCLLPICSILLLLLFKGPYFITKMKNQFSEIKEMYILLFN